MIELNAVSQTAINDVISVACKKLIENINAYDEGDFCGSDAQEIFEALAVLSKLNKDNEQK